MSKPLLHVGVLALVWLVSSSAVADDAFYRLARDKVQIVEGQWPKPQDGVKNSRGMAWLDATKPYVRLDGPGEAYLEWRRPFVDEEPDAADGLFVRAPAGQDVTGWLFVPKPDGSGMTKLKFWIGSSAATPESQAAAREAFYTTKATHFDRLVFSRAPGSAWFRHEATSARSALANSKDGAARANQQANAPGATSLENTYDLFTGGRALSENLQLDRTMRIDGEASKAVVAIDALGGIDVKEMDWQPLVKELKPELDPLSKHIPVDQHAVFLPSFEAFRTVIEEVDRQGTPIIQLLEPRSEESGTKARYQRQLCLSLTALGKVIGPQVIGGVAVTGSDPYLRAGSDVAVLFEAKDVGMLRQLIAVQVAAGRQGSNAKTVEGDIAGVRYSGAVSPDRSVSSYTIVLGDAVVVTNSLAQLRRLVAAHQGKEPSLATSLEYKFFRDRYKRGDASESAFVLLTDATIRRWCGPRWRIADSRRTRAAAVMADLQAQVLDHLVNKTTPTQAPAAFAIDLGEVSLTSAGVASSTYGNLEFMTPIVELDLDKATQPEAEAYKRWRDSYQRNWSQFFDPIAIRLSMGERGLAGDMTVMPLIARSDYLDWINVSKGAALAPGGADAHAALVQFAMAINTRSRMFAEGTEEFGIPGLNLMSWLGDWVSVYLDDDPFWKELAAAEDSDDFIDKNLGRLPVGLAVGVKDSGKLVAFLAAARGMIETSAPKMTTWTAVEHAGGAYTRIDLGKQLTDGLVGEESKLAVHYAALPDVLVISLNEGLVKRAVERSVARRKAGREGEVLLAKAEPQGTANWLGKNVALRTDVRFVEAADGMFGMSYQTTLQVRSWANLPILNQWKLRYADQDPVALHERFWQTRLVCPGGGTYAWNEEFQTMESTVYGHPGQPKKVAKLPPALRDFGEASFGVDFEENGLRARAALQKRGQ